MVLVIKHDGTAGEPCSNSTARILIKENKAVIYKYKPFTIRLTFNIDEIYVDSINNTNIITTEGNN